ncbi:MAG: CHASE2 domain-containing protein [Verrucomicrobiota bacterium]
MPVRLIIFLILSLFAAFLLGWQQSDGAFDKADRAFLSWLQANSGETSSSSSFSYAAVEPRPVILVRLADEERITFEDWPLTRLDYAVILSNLHKQNPALVALTPALYWPQVDEFGTGLLKTHIDALPAVVLGHRLAMGETNPDLPTNLTPIANTDGNLTGLPAFASIQIGPESGLSDATLTGFTHPSLLSMPGDQSTTVALVAKLQDQVYPSLPLLLIAAAVDAGPDDIDVRISDFSRVRIKSLTLPIESNGGFTLDPETTILTLDAETLIDVAHGTELVLQNLPPAQRNALSQLEDAVVIIGDDSPAAQIHQLPDGTRLSNAALLARLTASVLSGSSPASSSAASGRLWSPFAQYLLWAAIIAGGAYLMRFRKRRILFVSAAAAVAFIAATLVFYQITKTYPSPFPPLILILITLLSALLFPTPKHTMSS